MTGKSSSRRLAKLTTDLRRERPTTSGDNGWFKWCQMKGIGKENGGAKMRFKPKGADAASAEDSRPIPD